MAALFAPAWEDLPCIYCNTPVGSDGETDDGEFYSCVTCREAIALEQERVLSSYHRPDDKSPEKRRQRSSALLSSSPCLELNMSL